MYGIPEYNENGEPKCEICGNFFKRVLNHATQKHHVCSRDYKKRYGLDLTKGICSKESSNLTKMQNLKNWAKCVTDNILKRNQGTKFKKGAQCRKGGYVSEQDKIRRSQAMILFRNKTNK